MQASTWFRFLLVAIFLSFTHSANAISVSWGALAASAITQCEDPFCTTVLINSEEEAGDNMDANAMTELNQAGSLAFAQATLSGSSFTPTLSVESRASSDPNLLVFSSASGVQGYTNNGLDTTITVDLSLTADEVSGFAFVNAFAVVFRNTALLEITEDSLGNAFLGLGFENAEDSALLSAPAGNPPAPQLTSFSFEVLAGENFLIWAGLNALVSTDGVADVRNTLTMDLLEGADPIDLGQFSVSSQNLGVIPLPAGVWLFLTGVGLVAGLSRRRKLASAS